MIGAYLTDTVTIYTPGALDAYNNPAAGTSEVVAARVEWKEHLAINAQGEQVLAQAKIMMVYREVSPKSFIDYGGIRHVIAAITEPQDFSFKLTEVHIV